MLQRARENSEKQYGGVQLERFGKFQLLELVGRGGMAEIYLAKPADAVLSKLVAVKRILPQYNEDPSFREMFQQEGAIALQFRHHGIIAVHEMGIIDEQCYLSMEYFPGKTLAHIMSQIRTNKLKLEPTDVAFVVMRIADALNYIHDFRDYGGLREIIHRDISPHNIMIGFDGAIKLIDFGIAKDTSHVTTQSRAIKGKIAYMSPEQVRGEALTKQTDIFSLGIVFWELLSAKRLFTGNTVKEIVDKVRQYRQTPLLEDVIKESPSLFRICERALSERAQGRYFSAGEMASELQEYLRYSEVENQQKRMAMIMRELFSDELSKLKNMLRTYEGAKDITSPSLVDSSLGSYSSANSSSHRVSSPDGFSVASRTLVRKKKTWLIPSLVIGAFALTVGGIIFSVKSGFISPKPGAAPIGAHPSASAPATASTAVTPPPASATAASPSTPSVPQAQTQSAEPADLQPTELAPNPAPVVPQPLPPAKPAKVPHAKPTRKTTAAVPAPPPKPAPKKIAETKTKIKQRQPAATPPAPKTAFVTILADPNAKIYVDGKYIGKEVTNEIKVPAGQALTVKTISTEGKAKSKSFTFKPSSRNVVEMFQSGK